MGTELLNSETKVVSAYLLIKDAHSFCHCILNNLEHFTGHGLPFIIMVQIFHGSLIVFNEFGHLVQMVDLLADRLVPHGLGIGQLGLEHEKIADQMLGLFVFGQFLTGCDEVLVFLTFFDGSL